MTPPTEVIIAPLVRDRRRVLGDLVVLTKPRVVLMILVTTLVCYYVGLSGAPDWTRLLHLALGTALAAGGTLALNQYWERDVDARMERTRGRPLPDGRLMPLEALVSLVITFNEGIIFERLSGIETGQAELLQWIDRWLVEKERT